MINAVVKPRQDGLYDFALYASENGNLLASSNQGYERAIDAEAIARRLAPAGEPMHLVVRHRDGTSTTETIHQWSQLVPGVVAIATERAHQIAKGYTAAYDAQHGPARIIDAALAYMVQAQDRIAVSAGEGVGADGPEHYWPWDWDSFSADDNELQSLAKAGALIAAAYDAAVGGAS